MAEVNYTLTHKKDVYYILNDEAVPLDYTLQDIDPCTTDDVVSVGQIAVAENFEVPLIKDGVYQINLTEGANESNIYIKYYLNLQLSMIEDIFTVLCPCDCGCANCTDLSTDKYQALLTTRNKIDVFKYLSSSRYDAVFTVVHKGTACLVEPQLYCDITTEGVTGMAAYNEQLTKQLIALDYLAMYFADLKGVTDQEEIDYINNKYQSDSILCCINKLGINIKEIETLINDMATGTITSAVYVNLGPTDVGFLNINVANRSSDGALTVLNFTENVASYPPAADDPNPDPANNVFHSIRIDTILATGDPSIGLLKYNGTSIIAGVLPLVITMVEVGAGALTYSSPDTDPADIDTFTYSVSNVGAPTTFVS
jgi:hypothetical protein